MNAAERIVKFLGHTVAFLGPLTPHEIGGWLGIPCPTVRRTLNEHAAWRKDRTKPYLFNLACQLPKMGTRWPAQTWKLAPK